MQILNSLKMRWIVLALAAATLSSVALGSEWFSGKVVSIKDGDTIGIMRDGQEVVVRLDGIDCPESNQDFGQRAKQYCSDLVFGKNVTVEVRDIDKYGRLIGRVYVDYEDVSLSLVRAGLAWHYVEYSNDANLDRAEMEARETNSGLWNSSTQVPPWQFRHPESKWAVAPIVNPLSSTLTQDETPDEETQRSGSEQIVYKTKTGKKYHSEGCRHLSHSAIPIELGYAVAGGLTPCSVCAPPVMQTNSEYVPSSEDGSNSSNGTVKVKGYYRKDGTYVKPHTRSKPNKKRK